MDLSNRYTNLRLQAKCSDMCSAEVSNSNETMLLNPEGYAPSYLAANNGDYVLLNIDIETGTILGWTEKKRRLLEHIKAIESMEAIERGG